MNRALSQYLALNGQTATKAELRRLQNQMLDIPREERDEPTKLAIRDIDYKLNKEGRLGTLKIGKKLSATLFDQGAAQSDMFSQRPATKQPEQPAWYAELLRNGFTVADIQFFEKELTSEYNERTFKGEVRQFQTWTYKGGQGIADATDFNEIVAVLQKFRVWQAKNGNGDNVNARRLVEIFGDLAKVASKSRSGEISFEKLPKKQTKEITALLDQLTPQRQTTAPGPQEKGLFDYYVFEKLAKTGLFENEDILLWEEIKDFLFTPYSKTFIIQLAQIWESLSQQPTEANTNVIINNIKKYLLWKAKKDGKIEKEVLDLLKDHVALRNLLSSNTLPLTWNDLDAYRKSIKESLIKLDKKYDYAIDKARYEVSKMMKPLVFTPAPEPTKAEPKPRGRKPKAQPATVASEPINYSLTQIKQGDKLIEWSINDVHRTIMRIESFINLEKNKQRFFDQEEMMRDLGKNLTWAKTAKDEWLFDLLKKYTDVVIQTGKFPATTQYKRILRITQSYLWQQIEKPKPQPATVAPEPQSPPQPAQGKTFAVWMDLDKIKTDPKRFQNRIDSFSEASARSVAESLDWNIFDPIVVWLDPKNGNTYVLSGHSRYEGLRRRNEPQAPVRYYEGSEAEAIQFARIQANRTATAESLVEDLRAYKLARDGDTKKGIPPLKKTILHRDFKGKWQKLEDLSYLDPVGSFIGMLASNNVSEFPYAERLSRWVGQLRRDFPEITNDMERNIWEWSYDDVAKGYKLDEPTFKGTIEQRLSTGRELLFDCYSGKCEKETKTINEFLKASEERRLQKTVEKLDKDTKRIRERLKTPKGSPDAIYTEEERELFRKWGQENEETRARIIKETNQAIRDQKALFGRKRRESVPLGMTKGTRYVVRYTNHPKEDVERGFSTVANGGTLEEWDGFFDNLEDMQQVYRDYFDIRPEIDYETGEEFYKKIDYPDYAWHPRYKAYVRVHYWGLGAYLLDSDNLKDAQKEVFDKYGEMDEGELELQFLSDVAMGYEEGGDGKFHPTDVIKYHKTKVPSLWIFELH